MVALTHGAKSKQSEPVAPWARDLQGLSRCGRCGPAVAPAARSDACTHLRNQVLPFQGKNPDASSPSLELEDVCHTY